MKPIIIDNFLSTEYNQFINTNIFGENTSFNWFHLPNVSGAELKYQVDGVTFNKNQDGFYHGCYSHNQINSNIYDIFVPVLNKIEKVFDVKINELIRIRIGMNMQTAEAGSHYPHTDLDTPNKTFLYYVDESDGDTIFYKRDSKDENKLTVDFRNPHTQNQAVLFDGLTLHSSSSPIKYNRRTTVNINFV